MLFKIFKTFVIDPLLVVEETNTVWMESHLGQGTDRLRMPNLPATVVDSVALLSSESWPAMPTLAVVGAVLDWEEAATIMLIILLLLLLTTTTTAAVQVVVGVAVVVCRPDTADINIELTTTSRDVAIIPCC